MRIFSDHQASKYCYVPEGSRKWARQRLKTGEMGRRAGRIKGLQPPPRVTSTQRVPYCHPIRVKLTDSCAGAERNSCTEDEIIGCITAMCFLFRANWYLLNYVYLSQHTMPLFYWMFEFLFSISCYYVVPIFRMKHEPLAPCRCYRTNLNPFSVRPPKTVSTSLWPHTILASILSSRYPDDFLVTLTPHQGLF